AFALTFVAFAFTLVAFAFALVSFTLSLGTFVLNAPFAGTLGLARSWAREGEGDCLGALVTAPAPRGSIFLGKVLANLVFVGLTAAMIVPLSMLFWSRPTSRGTHQTVASAAAAE
ncbi:MAG TPA: hypothetical protein EYQ31_07025, partial [Candidatus Handelsmanbacteria bacterium]|nr:hypothetical protein [Candidatus Handelsmanbacteria bacterium]